MTEPTRRELTIDDPVAGREAYHVAHPDPADVPHGHVRHIRLGDIRPNPSQPRKQFDEAALSGLADSIRERGVLGSRSSSARGHQAGSRSSPVNAAGARRSRPGSRRSQH